MKFSCGGPQTTQITTPKTQPRSPKEHPIEAEIEETQQHQKQEEHSLHLQEEGAVEEEILLGMQQQLLLAGAIAQRCLHRHRGDGSATRKLS